jgi:hypothetical protein
MQLQIKLNTQFAILPINHTHQDAPVHSSQTSTYFPVPFVGRKAEKGAAEVGNEG